MFVEYTAGDRFLGEVSGDSIWLHGRGWMETVHNTCTVFSELLLGTHP